MADYLEAYAARFGLPVRTGMPVDGVTSNGDGSYVVTAAGRRFEADNVVVATGAYQVPTVPAFASQLDPGIVQLHSNDYRGPSQLRDGGVLVVGAGNSGAEIALESTGAHRVWLSGREVGAIPFRIGGLPSRLFLERLALRVLFHRVLTVKTPMGRKMRARMGSRGTPLIRIRPKEITAAGVERVGRVAGVRDGRPVLEDGRVLEVANVVWCTGFHHDFSWIDVPGVGDGEPAHRRGVVEGQPGLYLVGLHFLYAMSSAMIQGAGRDAEHIARHIAARVPSARRVAKEPVAA
jgi:putative flavoprotein involved in K+ transport